MNIVDYEEKKKHGTDSFPIEYYCVDRSHIHYVMQLHWHKELEIVRVLSGRLHVFLNSREYIAEAGDIVFIGGRVLTRAEPVDCVYECVVFDLNMLRGYRQGMASNLLAPLIAGDVEMEPCLSDKSVPLYSATVELFETMKKALPFYELEVCGILNKIFYHIFSGGRIREAAGALRGHKKKTIAALVDWIEKSYTEKITLRMLADLSGFNEKYLCRIFREFTGQTPTEYINRLRVERASFEMASNNKSVTEAAYESGFNELSHFSRTFKKYKGISPREFCRRIKGENKNA